VEILAVAFAVLAASLACAQDPSISASTLAAGATSAALAAPAAPTAPAASTAPAVSTAAAGVEVTLSAVGDIRLSGPIADIAREGGPEAPSKGVKDLLAADIEFANLETPITVRGDKTPKKWNFRSKPRDLKIVRAAGITVVNIANNHVWDYGRDGFLDTLKYLEKDGWTYVGCGRDRAAAEEVRLFEFEGLTVGIVGLTSTHPEAAWAGKSKPGVAYSDFDRMGGIVGRAKARCDVLVVSFHGGTELADDANDIQKAVAHAAIDAGADLFLGHHPHVLQPVEMYKGKPILYSLGNFLFVSPTPTTRPEIIVRARLAKDGVRRLDLIPLDGNWGRPKPASPEIAAAARAALDRLGALEARPDLIHFGAEAR
jgi:poly-gamma-glutamate capsule biosynthesis protein CapA/YwtB (metallophosphatase superfamily)